MPTGGGTAEVDSIVVSCDYGTNDDKQSQSHKPTIFTRDPKKFSW